MKKILFTIISIFLICGCNKINNTPTKQVETFFNKYQTLDADVIKDLDRVISEEVVFDTNARDKYRELIKNQYKNLTYKIKDEFIDGDIATVTAEITVIDYGKILTETEAYKNNNIEEFQDEDGNYDSVKYSNYAIKKLESAKDKITYTVELSLTKQNDKWNLNNISEDTEDKILGIYR